MARVELISERSQASGPEQQAVFDAVVASRGRMIRPFEVLLHTPGLASVLSDLGAHIRFAGSLSDHDRELAIMTAAAYHRCEFEWTSHHALALDSGVRPELLEHLQGGQQTPTEWEAALVEFVRELCSRAGVSDRVFVAVADRLGTEGVVELSVLIGYYTLLGFVMGAVEAC